MPGAWWRRSDQQNDGIRSCDDSLRLARLTRHENRGPTWRDWINDILDRRLQYMRGEQ